MSKGDRKRSNPTKEVEKSKTWMDEVEIPKDILADYPVPVLSNKTVNMFKELVELSNNVAGLFKQITDAELSTAKAKAVAKQLREGKIKTPMMQKISNNLYIPLYDSKMIADKMIEEVKVLEQATEISKKQLRHRYDEFVDSIRGFKNMLEGHLKYAPTKELATTIIGNRLNDTSKVEQKLFDKKVEEELKKAEDKPEPSSVKPKPKISEEKK